MVFEVLDQLEKPLANAVGEAAPMKEEATLKPVIDEKTRDFGEITLKRVFLIVQATHSRSECVALAL